ncbi:hypothetical protein TD95_004077 [Thielaviopsis punctulata]|uniref:Uncharacterized protein n=1 Tax=Thielaviopsis punctulata TaxID=72032 RepID=A0A0F4ZD81_9PEZI|nr:hypothetical protein TD95_004077 [Thielaviopsis punctulata]
MDSVLDFPQPWQKPPFAVLIACLRSLELKPIIWAPGTKKQRPQKTAEHRLYTPQHAQEIAIYLAGIIKSPLKWLESDEEREQVWDEASKRISERSGRSAMGDMTRCWPFPAHAAIPFELSIREPALTGDSLGFKTWGSSYLLALDLPRLRSGILSHLFASSLPSVVELGAGTGLLGIAAAAIWQTRVVLSDLPNITENLMHNAQANKEIVEKLGGSLEAGVLTWGSATEFDEGFFGQRNQYDKIVLAADPLYDESHPALLYSAIMQQMALSPGARLIVMVPQRDRATAGFTQNLRLLLKTGERPLECLEERSIDQHDDWGEDDDDDEEPDEHQKVKCWLGVFGMARNQQ